MARGIARFDFARDDGTKGHLNGPTRRQDTAITILVFVEELHWYHMKAFAILVLGVVTRFHRVDEQNPRPIIRAKLVTEIHK